MLWAQFLHPSGADCGFPATFQPSHAACPRCCSSALERAAANPKWRPRATRPSSSATPTITIHHRAEFDLFAGASELAGWLAGLLAGWLAGRLHNTAGPLGKVSAGSDGLGEPFKGEAPPSLSMETC